MKEDQLHKARCLGCQTNNPFLCVSFPGRAPAHAADHAAWLKRRARDRQRQLDLEAREARVFRREEVGA